MEMNNLEQEKKKSGKLKNFIVFLLIVGVFGGGGYYYLNHSDVLGTGGNTIEDCIVMDYVPEEDEDCTDELHNFNKETDCVWLKFTIQTDKPRYVLVQDWSEKGEMVKSAAVYDENGENLLYEMPFNDSNPEKTGLRSETFFPTVGETYAIKVELNDHGLMDVFVANTYVDWDAQ